MLEGILPAISRNRYPVKPAAEKRRLNSLRIEIEEILGAPLRPLTAEELGRPAVQRRSHNKQECVGLKRRANLFQSLNGIFRFFQLEDDDCRLVMRFRQIRHCKLAHIESRFDRISLSIQDVN